MDLRKFLTSTGRVIASSGTADFPTFAHGLLAAAVEFDRMDIVEWQVNDSLGRILAVNSLGLCTQSETTLPSATTVQKIIHMHGPRLLREGAPLRGSRNAEAPRWQCYLVSRRADRRYLVSLCR